MGFRKNYLTIEEMAEIVDEVKGYEESYIREMMKVTKVALCCLDNDFETKDATVIYNKLAEKNLLSEIEEEVTNYYVLERLIREERSVESAMTNTLKFADEVIESFMKGFGSDKKGK
jgi:hypothetical protein